MGSTEIGELGVRRKHRRLSQWSYMGILIGVYLIIRLRGKPLMDIFQQTLHNIHSSTLEYNLVDTRKELSGVRRWF